MRAALMNHPAVLESMKTPLARQVCVSLGSALLCAAAPVCPAAGDAGIGEALNKLRAQSCGAHEPLRGNPRLDRVAQLLASGTPLKEAQRQAGYHSVKLLSLQLSGAPDERSLGRMLRADLCAQLTTPGIRELGTYHLRGNAWIVLGEPFIAPDPADRDAIANRVLVLTNRARGQPRHCGSTWFPAAPAVTLDPKLTQAAREHSRDMAVHGYMDHRALDGSTPAERVARTGYRWRTVGENLASGIGTADGVVAGWLDSPHHCANLMEREFRQMGVAFGVNLDAPAEVYWTQVFGTPRP
jgi:uncharacterized protein YkwD